MLRTEKEVERMIHVFEMEKDLMKDYREYVEKLQAKINILDWVLGNERKRN